MGRFNNVKPDVHLQLMEVWDAESLPCALCLSLCDRGQGQLSMA